MIESYPGDYSLFSATSSDTMVNVSPKVSKTHKDKVHILPHAESIMVSVHLYPSCPDFNIQRGEDVSPVSAGLMR
jgi:hypothetical protein